MNIYCIRDRMLDYFQDPFTAPNDNAVLSSVAHNINNPEVYSAIKQAPHQFEIWRIAVVDDNGHIHESREYLADCSSLLRAGRTGAEPTAGSTPETAPQQTRSLSSSPAAQAALQQALGPKGATKAPKTATRGKTPRRGSN